MAFGGELAIDFRDSSGALAIATSPVDRGLFLGQERDLWPRAVAVELRPVDLRAGSYIGSLLPIFRTPAGTPQLGLDIEQARVRVRGIRQGDDYSLPPGIYDLHARVGGWRLREDKFRVELPSTGEGTPVTLEPQPEARTYTFLRDKLDKHLERVLNNSRVDTVPALDWLAEAATGTRRKACLLNLLACLRAVTPARGGSHALLDAVLSVSLCDIDRAFLRTTPEFHQNLSGLAMFRRDAFPLDKIHRRILTWHGCETADCDQTSFRQDSGPSLQIVTTAPGSGAHFAEIDIDLGNPCRDVVGLFTHLTELLDPGKTDHHRLYGKLRQSGIEEFLCYTLT